MAKTGSIRWIRAIFIALFACTVSVQAKGLDKLFAANSISGDATSPTADKGSDQNAQQGGNEPKKEKTPEEIMQARFPQPARADHLIGLPVLDFSDSTIGYVQSVVRTPEGKVRLIVPYGKRFGWARDWWPFNAGRRLVAVPIETVAILALQIDALDMVRSDFDSAPTWVAGKDKALLPDEMVKIAVARR